MEALECFMKTRKKADRDEGGNKNSKEKCRARPKSVNVTEKGSGAGGEKKRRGGDNDLNQLPRTSVAPKPSREAGIRLG